MAFLKVGANGAVTSRRETKKSSKGRARRKAKGIVYLLAMWLGEKDNLVKVFKIGVTARAVRPLETRISEICVDHFQKMRFFPMVDPRKFKKTEYYYEVESYLHRHYKDSRYAPVKKFDGSTELFVIEDEDALMELYLKVMKDPLEYITPTVKAEEAQEKEKLKPKEINMNDIDPSTGI